MEECRLEIAWEKRSLPNLSRKRSKGQPDIIINSKKVPWKQLIKILGINFDENNK